MNEFSSLDIIRAFNIPRGRFREWVEGGFIEASIEIASGKGTRNRFSRWNVYGIELFRKAIEAGLSRKAASAVYLAIAGAPLFHDSLPEHMKNNLKWIHFAIPVGSNTDTDEPEIIYNEDIEEAINSGKYDMVFSFNFQNIVKYVDSKL